MNLFGIHGLRSNEFFNFWPLWKREVLRSGGNFVIPQFPSDSFTNKRDWFNVLQEHNLSKYDGLIAHSIGCRILIDYLLINPESYQGREVFLVAPVTSVSSAGERIKREVSYIFGDTEVDEQSLQILASKYGVNIILGSQESNVDNTGLIQSAEKQGISIEIVNGRNHFLRMFGYSDISRIVSSVLSNK